jgi:hypothetical protein
MRDIRFGALPLPRHARGRARALVAAAGVVGALTAGGCGGAEHAVTAPPIDTTAKSTPTPFSFKLSPCSITGTLQLAVAQSARADCTNGGTTVTLAGNGASYLVVAEFASDAVPDDWYSYRLVTGSTASASLVPGQSRASASRLPSSMARPPVPGLLPPMRNQAAQLAFTRALRVRARTNLATGVWRAGSRALRSVTPSRSGASAVPDVGSLRQFVVLGNEAGTKWDTTSAKLAYAGSDVLIYIDTLAPANGFSPAQLQSFGQLFDQTLFPIDTAAFGSPSDIDANGRTIILMTPSVNKLVTASQCQTQGYVGGFFDEEDLSGGAADPRSNHGEIFYSIVPDSTGQLSCAHTVAGVELDVPATFMHELQHLISFSQHVVIHGGQPETGSLDEGLSIVAEELGSLHYEQQCPPPACRTNPGQLFPDSSQGFVSSFLYDSYQYALLPDTASITLQSDADGGFSWRGGAWLLMRYLGDQMGTGVYKKMDQSTLTGVANIAAATGQDFPTVFANFGIALFADSMPGQPRSAAPAADRFTTRNLRQLWNRLYVTSGGASDIPYANPLLVYGITSDTSLAIMDPGTTSFFRIDTPSGASTVSLQFAGAGGAPLAAALHPQLAIFRLPPGQ